MTDATVECTSIGDWLEMAKGNEGEPVIELGVKTYRGLKFKYRIRNVNPQARYEIRLLFTRESDHTWHRRYGGIGFDKESNTLPTPSDETSFIQHVDLKSGEELLRGEVNFEKIYFVNRRRTGSQPRNAPNYTVTLTPTIKYFVEIAIINKDCTQDASRRRIQSQHFIAVTTKSKNNQKKKTEDRHDSAPSKRRRIQEEPDSSNRNRSIPS